LTISVFAIPEIKPGRSEIFEVEPSKAVDRQAFGHAQIKVAIPFDVNQNHASFEKHLMLFVWVGLGFGQNVTELKHWTKRIYMKTVF
jgi:hypothetical protein